MLIWRGLKPSAIVAAMLAVQSEWRRKEQGRAAGAGPVPSDGVVPLRPALQATEVPRFPSGAVTRLSLLDGAKPGRPLP